MVHSDSMSPTSPVIWSKLFRRLELNTSLAEGSARHSQQTLTLRLGLPSLSGFHPRQDHQEGRVLRTTARPIGRNDSQRPVPNLTAQECDPLIHWGKPQHETAELGGNKQTHPSPPPLPVGHSRVEESPAPLEEMGSRAHAVRGGESDYF
ncbi:hypothetical protein CRENBAI_010324 [Crenichthys baileyi]|uniref:Uncharacterized protein n=1 Tax=Crenichthys baileyi TaxID=28760 RepID=A0AAV9R8V1_9TELE